MCPATLSFIWFSKYNIALIHKRSRGLQRVWPHLYIKLCVFKKPYKGGLICTLQNIKIKVPLLEEESGGGEASPIITAFERFNIHIFSKTYLGKNTCQIF
jgi:hypothetical protein